jgi:glycine cleavage system H protein
MSEIPAGLKFARTHEWARLEADGTVTVGITDFAQDALGDVVFVEHPEVGRALLPTDEAGVVESVKAASDIFSPVAGTVLAVNAALDGAPEKVNEDPYGEGWFFRIQPDDPAELDDLLDAAAYAKHCESEQH